MYCPTTTITSTPQDGGVCPLYSQLKAGLAVQRTAHRCRPLRGWPLNLPRPGQAVQPERGREEDGRRGADASVRSGPPERYCTAFTPNVFPLPPFSLSPCLPFSPPLPLSLLPSTNTAARNHRHPTQGGKLQCPEWMNCEGGVGTGRTMYVLFALNCLPSDVCPQLTT